MTSCQWGSKYRVVLKSFACNVNLSPGIILTSVTSNLFGYIRSCIVSVLHYNGCFWVQLVTYSDSQISEVIALNPSFTMFSSKINIQDLILKDILFVYV